MPKAERDYSLGEEIANSVTHGLGAVLSIVGLVALIVLASRAGDARHIVSATVFGAALVLLYLSSTLYHALTAPRAKRVFKTLDHAVIYLLIAGTYTPFTLLVLRGRTGWMLFALVWALAIGGVVLEALWLDRSRLLSVLLYVAMGWVVVFFARPLSAALPGAVLGALVIGGVTYTLGTIFYSLKRVPYMHAVWHVFVLAGSAFHFAAVGAACSGIGGSA